MQARAAAAVSRGGGWGVWQQLVCGLRAAGCAPLALPPIARCRLEPPPPPPPPPPHTRREVLYEESATGGPPTKVTGLRMTKAAQEQIVEADVYVAALDVPGAKRLIPEVSPGWWG